MALMKSSEIPKDAVIVDDREAALYVWDIIEQWTPKSDTWALRYSMGILGGASALSGLVVNNYFRRKLKLGKIGHMSSVIPVTMMSGMAASLFHRQAVTTEMLLMKRDACPLCFELRSAAIQVGFGAVYPMMLAPMAALMLANRYGTVRMPSLLPNPMDVLRFTYRLGRPFAGTLLALAAAQAALSSWVTYCEMRNHLVLRMKLLELEKKLDNGDV